MCSTKKRGRRLDKAPYPGEIGQRILENASKEAWGMWMKQQTMLMNENKLSPMDPKHRQFLVDEMEKFFFGEGSTKVEGYTPE